jgi:DUF1365 family protein
MNSCLYTCTVMHNRLEPKRNAFNYGIFMFYLDLDEIDDLHKNLKLFSRNKANIFNFRDSDHLELPKETPVKGRTVKQNITTYINRHGVDIGNGKIMLITNVKTMGYIFNPVSFYFCYDEAGEPQCAVVEVCNTFLEMKLYFISKEELKDGKFHQNTQKFFYVSPFIELDTFFDFNLYLPNEKLNVRIDDFKDGKRFFISTLTGKKVALTDLYLLWYSICFPFITIKIITLIHWQALILWIKKIPFISKNENLDLQKEALKPNNK